MAIKGVSSVTVGELLGEPLRIPHYQRPYSWRRSTARQLLNDIQDAQQESLAKDGPYVLGAVILHERGPVLDIVDGQQRLLTLQIVLAALEGQRPPTDHENHLIRVWRELARQISVLSPDERTGLRAYIKRRCLLVKVVTSDIDEAFRVFDSQNFRGKPLEPHDLLKAHHLREMRESDAMTAAIVETWENADDEDLQRLFGVYLYRIARWSRGQRADRGLTTRHLALFKGIAVDQSLSPSDRYHLAAQTALPVLDGWPGGEQGAAPLPDQPELPGAMTPQQKAAHARFQLDAPIVAGRPFFEMVAFMLAELPRLRKFAFHGAVDVAGRPIELETFASSDRLTLAEKPYHSYYRFVSELYLASLLYYTNKFGDADRERARRRLFAWSFTLRTNQLTVQFRSMDNRGSGNQKDPSAFRVLRGAISERDLDRLAPSIEPARQGHAADLVAVLKGWEG